MKIIFKLKLNKTKKEMSILNNIFIFIFLFNYIPEILSQKEEYKCALTRHNLKVGEEIILCIHILKENKKVAMPIKVDEYSMISFNHIYKISNDILQNKKEIEFIAQIGDVTTINPTVSI